MYGTQGQRHAIARAGVQGAAVVTLTAPAVPFLSLCSAYKDMKDRNETRQAAWEFPGWDECVVRTGAHPHTFPPSHLSHLPSLTHTPPLSPTVTPSHCFPFSHHHLIPHPYTPSLPHTITPTLTVTPSHCFPFSHHHSIPQPYTPSLPHTTHHHSLTPHSITPSHYTPHTITRPQFH